MAKLEKFCCCCDLQIGCFIIAALFTLENLYILYSILSIFQYMDASSKALELSLIIPEFILCFVLVVGAVSKKTKVLWFWVICHGILLLVSVSLFLYFNIKNFDKLPWSSFQFIVTKLFLFLFNAGFGSYSLFAVYSYGKEVSS